MQERACGNHLRAGVGRLDDQNRVLLRSNFKRVATVGQRRCLEAVGPDLLLIGPLDLVLLVAVLGRERLVLLAHVQDLEVVAVEMDYSRAC